MKPLSASLSLLFVSLHLAEAGTEVFDYEDFGPQVAVHEMIGFGWFQWDSHGDSDPKTKPGIKVVVYWNEELENVRERYPIDESKLKDYRYLELETAVRHLRTLISDFDSQELDTDALRATLRRLSVIRSSEQDETLKP